MMLVSPQNNIKALRKKRGLSSLELARKIGTSAPHMSRLINGQSPLTMKWTLRLSAALNVPTSKIVGVKAEQRFVGECDDTLLGSIMGWILEASKATRTPLSRSDLTKLTSFVYKEAIEQPLDFKAARYLAISAVKIKGLLRKK